MNGRIPRIERMLNAHCTFRPKLEVCLLQGDIPLNTLKGIHHQMGTGEKCCDASLRIYSNDAQHADFLESQLHAWRNFHLAESYEFEEIFKSFFDSHMQVDKTIR